MVNYNPVTHPFCKNCPHYKPNGNYVYELEYPGKQGRQNRKCRNLKICLRISKIGYQQLKLRFVL